MRFAHPPPELTTTRRDALGGGEDHEVLGDSHRETLSVQLMYSNDLSPYRPTVYKHGSGLDRGLPAVLDDDKITNDKGPVDHRLRRSKQLVPPRNGRNSCVTIARLSVRVESRRLLLPTNVGWLTLLLTVSWESAEP